MEPEINRCPHRPDPGDGGSGGLGWGWAYRFGPIQMITCHRCVPVGKDWIKAIEFVK